MSYQTQRSPLFPCRRASQPERLRVQLQIVLTAIDGFMKIDIISVTTIRNSFTISALTS